MSKYSLKLRVKGDVDKLYDCFLPEISKQDRSSLDIKKEEKHILFNIESKDIVALKATINSALKLLEVEEKLSSIIENE